MTAAEHTLIRDGWPHARPTDEWQTVVTGNPDQHVGRALCSCGVDSAPFSDSIARRAWHDHHITTEARRQAHAQHVTEENVDHD